MEPKSYFITNVVDYWIALVFFNLYYFSRDKESTGGLKLRLLPFTGLKYIPTISFLFKFKLDQNSFSLTSMIKCYFVFMLIKELLVNVWLERERERERVTRNSNNAPSLSPSLSLFKAQTHIRLTW